MNNFIIFEGPDFSGKTTVLEKIMSDNIANPTSFYTREPGSFLVPSSSICEDYRKNIKTGNHTPFEEATLFAKSRLLHTKDIVEYLQIHDVICDRYIISSLAYQGYAQELGKDIIYRLNNESLKILQENNVKMNFINFNISQEEWLKRKSKRLKIKPLDNIESKNLDYKVLDFFSTRYIYEYYTDELNANYFNINANLSVDEICSDVLKIIKSLKE